MQTTTGYAIRDDVITQVREIVPNYPRFQDSRFIEVDRIAEVEGGELRRFYVMLVPGITNPTLIHGCGITWDAEIRVYVNYAGIDDRDVDGITESDSSQIYLAIERRTDPTLPGFLPPISVGWISESDEEGHVWGYHSIPIQYLRSDQGNS